MSKEALTKNFYDSFVRQGRSVGFTDDQIDFIWEWFWQASVNKETFTHKDNYVEQKQ